VSSDEIYRRVHLRSLSKYNVKQSEKMSFAWTCTGHQNWALMTVMIVMKF